MGSGGPRRVVEDFVISGYSPAGVRKNSTIVMQNSPRGCCPLQLSVFVVGAARDDFLFAV